jgi:hypothetical protein
MKLSLFLIGLLASLCASGQDLIGTEKIWDSAPHNAFTDLVRFRGDFYCAFREGNGHVPKDRSDNGKIRILRSKDAVGWESVALLSNGQYDLRDAKISVTPDHRLMVLMGGSDYTTGKLEGCLTHVSFSDDGLHYSVPLPVSIDPTVRTPFDWIWRVTWHKGVAYGVVYQPMQPGGGTTVRLLSSKDGVHYQQLCDLELEGQANEASIRFQKGRMFIIIRRDGPGANGLLGQSDPPYTDWKWTDLGMKVGGPEFVCASTDRIILGTRLYRPARRGGVKTGLVVMDRAGKIEKVIDLPSGGDTSYPGMVMYRGKLYVSYYSSHEGRTSIYLSVVGL